MSEDRFKQARKSLIDRDNRQDDSFDDGFEDEATAMVDLNSMDRPQGDQKPQFGPPPNFSQAGDASTEMFSIEEYGDPAGQPGASGSVQMPGSHSGQSQHPPPPTYPGQNAGQQHQQGQYQQGQQQQQFGQANQSQQIPGQQQPGQQQQGGYDQGPSGQQMVIGGGASDFEGATQFLNISELADGAHHVAPDEEAVGYDGNTQFVNLAELQAGAGVAATGGGVENDQVLRQSYQFGPENIQQGEFTLVFAVNQMGRQVVLKRVWEGDVNSMPAELRQRVAALDPIRHPRLINLNGMLATSTGAWVEFNQPTGYRLTDVLAQNGPQPKEQVVAWIKQAAEVLDKIHQFQFVYANMDTNAIWVQDDGSILLEPFDVLTFENRGNLGPFGPPELSVPPEQRQVSPATDVYSLSALMIAALTGLPLNLQAYESLDKKLSSVALQGLSQNPAERQPTPGHFAAELDKGGLPELNMKMIIGIAAVMGILLLGAMFYQQEEAKKARAMRAQADAAAAAKASEKDPNADPATVAGTESATNSGTNQAEAVAVKPVDAPGPVEADPRLEIKTSFVKNPVIDEEEDVVVDPEEIEAMRKAAREEVKGIKRLTDKARREKYGEALKLMAKVQRLRGELSEEDQKFVSDLFDESDVKKIRRENLDAVLGALKEDNLTSAKLQYQRLELVDADAVDKQFFSRNKAAKILKLEKASAATKDGPENDEKKDE